MSIEDNSPIPNIIVDELNSACYSPTIRSQQRGGARRLKMVFVVKDERLVSSYEIARDFEHSDADDQADLINDLGAVLDAHLEDERMARYADDIAQHLEKDGEAFILAIARSLSKS